MARPGLTEIGGTWVVDGSVKPWVPSGPRIPVPPPLQPRAKFPKAQPADLRKSLAASGTPSGAPSFVIATQEQIVEQGRTLALVTVSFVPPTPTSDVIGTNIWITGYKGNANWELISTTSQSPAQFVLEQTGDTVGVFCQSFGASGASTAPFTKQAYVTLSGPGAPPAPALSQDLTVTPTGYQFTITQESGLLTNVVAGYNVYRNSVNDAATSTKIAHLKQDPTNTGGLVFSDVQPNGVTMYYWVTAVNTWGNESTFVAAQTGAVLAVTPITSAGDINGGSSISGVTETSLTAQQLHDRVSATIDGYANAGLDNVLDGSTYARTRGAFLGSGVPLVSAGKNLLQNPGFEFNNTGNPGQQDPPPTWPCDGWKVWENDGPCGIGWDAVANDLQRSGVGCAIFRQRSTGVALAANTTYNNWLASAHQPAREGETWVAKGYRRLDNNATPSADLTVTANFVLDFFDAAGTVIQSTYATGLTTANGGYQYVQVTATAPADTAFVSLFLGSTWVVGATGQTTPTATTWGDVRFDDCALNCQIDYANEVLDGQTDANGAQWNRLAQVASDNTGVTLGYSGAVGLVVGNGFIAPSTGGYLPRRTVWSGPTGTEANGTVISFSALADQSGNPLPSFDTAPLVSLAPYNMSTAPALLYASGVTASGFTLNSYSAATASEGSAVNLPNGTPTSVPATAGTTITGVVFTATVTAKTITPEQNFSQVVTVYVGGVAVGTITINGKTGGGTYHSSATDAVSGNPTSVTAEATWTLSSDVSSVTVSATPQQISGETAVSANVTCAITEQYNS